MQGGQKVCKVVFFFSAHGWVFFVCVFLGAMLFCRGVFFLGEGCPFWSGFKGREEGRREGGKEGKREGGKEGRREGGKEGRKEGV